MFHLAFIGSIRSGEYANSNSFPAIPASNNGLIFSRMALGSIVDSTITKVPVEICLLASDTALCKILKSGFEALSSGVGRQKTTIPQRLTSEIELETVYPLLKAFDISALEISSTGELPDESFETLPASESIPTT